MFRRLTLASMLALSVATAVIATPPPGETAAIDSATTACVRHAVFTRPVDYLSYESYYFTANDCETVYADHVTVKLAQLTGTLPRAITVRNVGNETLSIIATSPDVIDATVFGYSTIGAQPWLTPGTALLCCAGATYYLAAQHAVTFTAHPFALANSWFTTADR